jgi:hypothetical protein
MAGNGLDVFFDILFYLISMTMVLMVAFLSCATRYDYLFSLQFGVTLSVKSAINGDVLLVALRFIRLHMWMIPLILLPLSERRHREGERHNSTTS